MPDLPPDLTRLGDALEHAVSRAIARRRAQLRAAWALAAVVAAVPMALAATNLYVRSSDVRAPAAAPPVAVPAADREPVTLHPGPERGDRVPPGHAGRRSETSPHPLDSIPPPVGARAARGYDPGVASERTDRRPAFVPTLI